MKESLTNTSHLDSLVQRLVNYGPQAQSDSLYVFEIVLLEHTSFIYILSVTAYNSIGRVESQQRQEDLISLRY